MATLKELSSDNNPLKMYTHIRVPPEPNKITAKINWTQFQKNLLYLKHSLTTAQMTMTA